MKSSVHVGRADSDAFAEAAASAASGAGQSENYFTLPTFDVLMCCAISVCFSWTVLFLRYAKMVCRVGYEIQSLGGAAPPPKLPELLRGP